MDLRDYIQIFDKTEKPELIGSFLIYLNKQNFNQATIVGDEKKTETVNKNIRNTKTFNFFKDEKNLSRTHWYNYWEKMFNMYLTNYEKATNIRTISSQISTLDALKYEEGGFYIPHTDYHLKFPRNISIVYFLNNDYEGGQLNFYDPSNHNKIILPIEPRVGRLVMFPSNYLYPHAVQPVEKGTRYVLVSWIS